MIMKWDVEVCDEVECIWVLNKDTNKTIILARHNISKQIMENPENIPFPAEEISNITEDEWRQIKLQKMHKLLGDSTRMENLYKRYSYLIDSWSTTRWARNPYTPKTFDDTVLYMQNARNILFYYCIEKAKKKILEQHREWKLHDDMFKRIVKKYNRLFVLLAGSIPLEYQDEIEFENRFADTKEQVGLK